MSMTTYSSENTVESSKWAVVGSIQGETLNALGISAVSPSFSTAQYKWKVLCDMAGDLSRKSIIHKPDMLKCVAKKGLRPNR